MKKVYSLIIILCSFGMIGFASTASQVSSMLPTDSSPGNPGNRTVVRSSTILNGAARSAVSSGQSNYAIGTAGANVVLCSNGWLSLLNSRSTTANNKTGTMPGAGFLVPAWNAPESRNSSAFFLGSDGFSPRVFAFDANQSAKIAGISIEGSPEAITYFTKQFYMYSIYHELTCTIPSLLLNQI